MGGSGGNTAQAGGLAGSGGRLGTGGTSAAGGSNGTGGKSGSGGTPGTGGAIGTGGSTGPTACSFPSGWAPGSPTYTTYDLPNPATACGYTGSNNNITNIAVGANYAAIPGASPSNFDTSSRCGACVQIGNAIVTIVDECPYDSASNNAPCAANPKGHLDLSSAAAGAAGVKGDPALKNQAAWKFIPCPINGNVKVRLKNGNDNEMKTGLRHEPEIAGNLCHVAQARQHLCRVCVELVIIRRPCAGLEKVEIPGVPGLAVPERQPSGERKVDQLDR